MAIDTDTDKFSGTGKARFGVSIRLGYTGKAEGSATWL